MCINMTMKQLKIFISFFETYRENRFKNTFRMDIEPKFCGKKTSRKKII